MLEILTEQRYVIHHATEALTFLGGMGGRNLLNGLSSAFQGGDRHGLVSDYKLISHIGETGFKELALFQA